jgi:hypothetical protein
MLAILKVKRQAMTSAGPLKDEMTSPGRLLTRPGIFLEGLRANDL